MAEKRPVYGGQAVIEGVMMGGRFTTVTAIRRKDHSIEFYEVEKAHKPIVNTLKKIPFLRGIVGILESSAVGTKHLQFASERYDAPVEEDIDSSTETGKWAMILGIAVIGIISFLFGKFIFTLVPAIAAGFFSPLFPGHTAQVLLEGVFKLLLLFGYIYFISLTPMMKRLFQYHGAEHKVINTFENGLALTVENVKRESRLHYRCGSSFILFTAVISIFLYLLPIVPVHPLWLRLIYRIILIPVDLGISYEFLQLTNKLRHIPVLRWLGYPGLWLQLLTTKEPDDQQIEVAIAAFNEMRRREAERINAMAMVL